jgi:hypothetical protein
MSEPQLIICERSPRWLAAWRRALPPRRWSWLSSALSLTQCEQQLRTQPGSVVAVSVAADNFATVAERISAGPRIGPLFSGDRWPANGDCVAGRGRGAPHDRSAPAIAGSRATRATALSQAHCRAGFAAGRCLATAPLATVGRQQFTRPHVIEFCLVRNVE